MILRAGLMTSPLVHVHIAPPQSAPMRLQEYGVGLFEVAPTRSAWKKVLKKHYVTVDGHPATTPTWIRGGEHIQLTMPEDVPPARPLHFPLRVLYEDDHLAAIHKPGGILVSGNTFKTIARALPQNLQPSPRADAVTPQPVHRLDYPTTGILLAGKTHSCIVALNQLFEEGHIHKQYYAVTIGVMPTTGRIQSELDAKSADTRYTLIKTIPSPRFGALNLVLLQPGTGRRHQLRRHLAGMGNPILGDPTYSPDHLLLKGKGLYLHAWSTRFSHPVTGEEIHLRDTLPKRFTHLFGPVGQGTSDNE